MDRWLDFAVWQAMRDLAPVWLPAVKEGKFDFGGNVDHLVYALKAAESPEVVQPLLGAAPARQAVARPRAQRLETIATLGGPKELGTIFDLVAAPDSKLPDARKADAAHRPRRNQPPPQDPARRRPQPRRSRSSIRKTTPSAPRPSAPPAPGKSPPAATSSIELAKASGGVSPLMAFAGPCSTPSPPTATPNPRKLLEVIAGDANELCSTARQPSPLSPRSTPTPPPSRPTTLLEKPPPASIRPSAIAAIASRKDGPQALAKALAGKKLDPDTAKLVLRTVRSAPQPSEELIAAVQSAGGLSEAAWKLTPELVAELTKEVQTKGDPARGEAIYRVAANQCLKCHAIGGAGGIVGPDMVSLGATAQIDYLLEALIAPAAKVKENFHSKVVLDQDGQVTSGIVVRDTEQDLVLRDAEDRVVTIAKRQHRQHQGRPLADARRPGRCAHAAGAGRSDRVPRAARQGRRQLHDRPAEARPPLAGAAVFERSQPQAQPHQLRHGRRRRPRLRLVAAPTAASPATCRWTACRPTSRTPTWSRRRSSLRARRDHARQGKTRHRRRPKRPGPVARRQADAAGGRTQCSN